VELGKYIVIEGHDGTGKSTQVDIVRQRLLDNYGIESEKLEEPGGTPIGDEIRTILKNGELERDPKTNLLLFTSARCELWKHMSAVLKIGRWVVVARNFYSSLAYQGYGEGLDLGLIEETTKTFTDEQYMNPNIPLILSLDDEVERAKRIKLRGELEKPDAFESKGDEFQSRVRNGYLEIAKSRNVPIISANQSIEKMADEIWTHIEHAIK